LGYPEIGKLNLSGDGRAEAKRTGYSPMRLSKLLWRKYTLGISPNTIKAILRRHGQRRKRRRVRRGSRPLYDYEHLLPFEEMQVDTKYILDQDSLPREVSSPFPTYKSLTEP